MAAASTPQGLARKNLRTAVILGLLALTSLVAFFVKVWQLS